MKNTSKRAAEEDQILQEVLEWRSETYERLQYAMKSVEDVAEALEGLDQVKRTRRVQERLDAALMRYFYLLAHVRYMIAGHWRKS